MYCEVCGFEYKDDETTCRVCMTKMPDDSESEDMIYCPKCGKRTNGKKIYCRACGKKTVSVDDGLTGEEREEAKRRENRRNLLGTNIAGLVIGFWLITGISSYFAIRKIEEKRELDKTEQSAKTIGKVCLIIGAIRLGIILFRLFIMFGVGR